jgi:RNA polymerase sigma factor (sigma-70 family)
MRDNDLAEEVTQIVFIILARKAATFRPQVYLPGWLLKTTRFTALNVLKMRARRIKHEREAQARKAADMVNESRRAHPDWQRIEPFLDDAMSRLNERDRKAIMLRYFQQQSVAETAEAIGISEPAAAMRVSRAVEKLRRFFRSRGIDAPHTLGLFIATNAIAAARDGFASTIAQNAMHALRNSAIPGATLAAAEAVMRAMALAKLKAAAWTAATILAGALAAGIIANQLVDRVHHPAPVPEIERGLGAILNLPTHAMKHYRHALAVRELGAELPRAAIRAMNLKTFS